MYITFRHNNVEFINYDINSKEFIELIEHVQENIPQLRAIVEHLQDSAHIENLLSLREIKMAKEAETDERDIEKEVKVIIAELKQKKKEQAKKVKSPRTP